MTGWEKSAITLAVFLPAAGALVIAMVPKSQDRMVRGLGILFTGAALVVGIIMLFGFDYGAHHGPLFGSVFMLLGFLAMFFKGPHTFDIIKLQQFAATSGFTQSIQLVIFAGVFLGFAIKVPMWPFHTWLPDAHTEAPTVGSVLLAG